MSKRKDQVDVDSWFLSKEEVAKLCGFGRSHFETIYPQLVAEGFPQPDDILGGWYIRAIQNWCDRRYGLTDAESDEDLFLRNVRGLHGNDQSGLSRN